MCPGRQVGRRWSAKPTMREFDSLPGLQALQRHLTARYSAHNRAYTGSTPVAATKCQMHRWCNGSTRVSKTFGQYTLREGFANKSKSLALSCPDRKSLHTRLMVRQLSLKQSMHVQFLFMNQQLFQLTWHTWCRSEVAERHVFQACN